MRFGAVIRNFLNMLLKPFRQKIVSDYELIEFNLHKYDSYEQYKDVQIRHNKRKINNVFADEATLKRVKDSLLEKFGEAEKINGICHGTRNGFEQNYLRSLSNKLDVIGTDISDTVLQYENSVLFDFHDINDDWIGSQDFVYTNSLDQSWKPHIAVQTWLNQLKREGILFIEHTEAHSVNRDTEMDPFGVKPTTLPYVLTMWFGSQINISHSVKKKSNVDLNAWLFAVSKNVEEVKLIDNSYGENIHI